MVCKCKRTREIALYVLVLDGEYADGVRGWTRHPDCAFRFDSIGWAKNHRSTFTYDEQQRMKIRKRTLRVPLAGTDRKVDT